MFSFSVAQLEYKKLILILQPKVSRRIAAEQIGSLIEFCYQFLYSRLVMTGVTFLDPVTPMNLIPIIISQYDHVVMAE
jgi:hypothetical protein